jgi:predicted enzyme related to lactoylglutathione lyase
MRVTGITANLPVADIATASEFYREYLVLSVEAMNLGWVARYTSADRRASLQLVAGDASAPQDSVISVHVGAEVDEAYAEARRRGYELVHPLTDEPWGVRRFFVRAPMATSSTSSVIQTSSPTAQALPDASHQLGVKHQ